MAITTYTELQTAVGNWLARADLSTRIPEFIALAEAKLNRDLRAQDQETKNAAISINAEYVNVPTGFLAVRSFQSTVGGERYSLRVLPDELQTNDYNDTGTPLFYSIVGAQFRFAPIPDTTYTATLVYYTKIVPLATTSPNWLLTSHPDIYLYASLLEAEAFLYDDPRLMVWKTGYEDGVAKLMTSHNRNRWSGPGLVQRPG